jgi:hypothetical protein
MVMLDLTTIKKDLYKSKAMANFSHYCAGNLYYTVMIEDSKYQFPMETIDYTLEKQNIWPEGGAGIVEVQFKTDNITLSADLGTTVFGAEIKASELIRWIGKALEKGELIKVG